MIHQTTSRQPTLLFQRVFVSSDEDPVEDDLVRQISRGCAVRVGGEDTYAALSLANILGDQRQSVILNADSGMTVMSEETNKLRAVYLLRGQFDKTPETIAKLQKRGDIDFEGTLQRSVAIEQSLAISETANGEATVVPCGPPEEPYLVNQLDGEQSEFFARIEKIVVLVSAVPGGAPVAGGPVEYEKLTRVNVSTKMRLEPRRRQKADLHSAVRLGEGVFLWNSVERHTDRYGFVFLLQEPGEGSAKVDLQQDGLVDRKGALICEVLQTRDSPIADHFRGFYSQIPQIGELIELGDGILTEVEGNSVGLKPFDEREIDWLNPIALYRCHLQTVRLWFLPTSQQ